MEILASELRIGNWVRFKHLLCFIITIKQDNCEIQSSRLVVNSSYDFIEPIPLTPEILEKCGFWQTKLDGEYIYSERSIISVYIDSIGLVTFKVGDIIFSTVHSLHQLQNLYYALTGEELNFKP